MVWGRRHEGHFAVVEAAEMARWGATDVPVRDLASDWMWEESKNRLAFLVCSRLESRMAGRMMGPWVHSS